ncbi:hypothetical protein [Streptomyces sp. NPDC096311]|uniref:hypothetical protein n=1 Tax=Streptomyces sp. NPDC096311 TaxID=3366083 RepID=UPI0038183F90
MSPHTDAERPRTLESGAARLCGAVVHELVRGVTEGAADRLAVGLRAGSFGLGSMWAVVSGASGGR